MTELIDPAVKLRLYGNQTHDDLVGSGDQPKTAFKVSGLAIIVSYVRRLSETHRLLDGGAH